MGKGPNQRIRWDRQTLRLRVSQALIVLPLVALLVLVDHVTSESQSDGAPYVTVTYPAHHAAHVSRTTSLTVEFSEPVTLGPAAVTLVCSNTEDVSLTAAGGPVSYVFTLNKSLAGSERCQATVFADLVTDNDSDDPPDKMLADAYWTFDTTPATAQDILINEVDAITNGNRHEFIELYDGGQGHTPLDGLEIAFYTGDTDTLYLSALLTGYETDVNGYFLLSSDPATADLRLADEVLLDGPAAVVLYDTSVGVVPFDSPIILNGVIDAMVYGPGQIPDNGLLPLLEPGEPQVDESGRSQPTVDSSQRCPNGSGGRRRTSTFRQNTPTPAQANECVTDAPPILTQIVPTAGAIVDPTALSLHLTFSEPVVLQPGAITLVCGSGDYTSLAISGGPVSFTAVPSAPPTYNVSCSATVVSQLVSDADNLDPPDHMLSDFSWSFTTSKQIATHLLINELDSDTPGTDTAEFIELYDGGSGHTQLDGLTLVLFNGNSDDSYQAIGLDGLQTDADGYFVIGSAATVGVDLIIGNGLIQNGPDAVALYANGPAAFPAHSPITTHNLLDALVYGAESDAGLLPLLNSGQLTVDEGREGHAGVHSLQRCPNSSGGQRNTATVDLGLPSPGQTNACLVDDPPELVSASPDADETDVIAGSSLYLTFSEGVALAADAVGLGCDTGGELALTVGGGPLSFVLIPEPALSQGDHCIVTIHAPGVTDLDTHDPPDAMTGDRSWGFQMSAVPVEGILINEFDADTPGTDTAEFIELYDGGRGNLDLDGLVLVLFNGADDASYRTINLAGAQTDDSGYLLLGGPDIAGSTLSLPAGAVQNGPDAIALYAAGPQQFPNGSPLSLHGLVDAVVYGTGDATATGLLTLLEPGQPQIDESSRGHPADDANQRCPNGGGGPRITTAFTQALPSPGSANICVTDEPPRVVLVQPADGAGGVEPNAALTVEFSEPVTVDPNWLHLTCTTSGPQSLSTSGGPLSFTATPATPFTRGEQCSATIHAAQVHDNDTLDPPDALSADISWSYTVESTQCLRETTPIAAVQGPGPASPFLGQAVTIMGVLTADFRDGLGGFFIQAEEHATDKDLTTSEALFIMSTTDLGPLRTGDLLLLDGIVDEIDQRTTLTGAHIVAICSSNVLITPQTLPAPPDSPAAWEAMESMLVTLGPSTIVIIDDLVASGRLRLSGAGRPIYPTEWQSPGPNAETQFEKQQAGIWTLDDGRIGSSPTKPFPDPARPIRVGDVVPSVTGIIDGYGGDRRLQPTSSPTIVTANPRPDAPARPSDILRLVNLDLGIYSNGDGYGGGFSVPGGAQSLAEYERQRAKVVALLDSLDADVVVLTGLENDPPGAVSAAHDLLDALNAYTTGSPLQLIAVPTAGIDGRAYQSVVFYRASTAILVDVAMPAAPIDGLAQPFLVRFQDPVGSAFAILVLHLDPRGDCPVTGPNANQHDGQACHNDARTQAAQSLGQWTSAVGYASHTLALGNWQAYGQETPLQTFSHFGFLDITPASPDQSLNDYTIVDQGQAGAIHRVLAGTAIVGHIAQTTVWHVNADESPALDFSSDNPPELYKPDPYRAATADPVILDLRLGALVVSFAADGPVFIGEAMHFSDRSTGYGQLHFSWNFGDGSAPVTVREPAHVYSRIGTYRVTLTVSTTDSSVSESQLVDVLPRRAYLPISTRGGPGLTWLREESRH